MKLKYPVFESQLLMTYILGWGAWVVYPRILIWNKEKLELLNHEFIHICQIEEMIKKYGWIGVPLWYILYVWKWITNGFSYRKIDWEVEAKLNEKDLTYIERTYPEIWEHIKHNFKTNDSNTK